MGNGMIGLLGATSVTETVIFDKARCMWLCCRCCNTSVGTKTEECQMCIVYSLFRGELLQESLIDVLIRISAMCEIDNLPANLSVLNSILQSISLNTTCRPIIIISLVYRFIILLLLVYQ